MNGIRQRAKVVFDEWQVVPGVIGAVKRAVDDDPRPGRFIVAGSVRGDLQGDLWPGTGRLTRIPLFGMTVREQLGLTTSEPLTAEGRLRRLEPDRLGDPRAAEVEDVQALLRQHRAGGRTGDDADDPSARMSTLAAASVAADGPNASSWTGE